MPLVLLALVPAEPLYSELRALQQEYSERVGSVKWRDAPAHITLVHPNKFADIDELVSQLTASVADLKPLTVSMPTIGFFRHHPTLYYTVAPNAALQTLHETALTVVQSLRDRNYNAYTRHSVGRAGELLREYGSEYVLERYFAHLSLSRSDSDKEKFRELVRELPMATPKTAVFDAISVLVHEEGAWTEYARVPLGRE
jgi:2'-5' RNA ligase